jgi:hypothetical protein
MQSMKAAMNLAARIVADDGQCEVADIRRWPTGLYELSVVDHRTSRSFVVKTAADWTERKRQD